MELLKESEDPLSEFWYALESCVKSGAVRLDVESFEVVALEGVEELDIEVEFADEFICVIRYLPEDDAFDDEDDWEVELLLDGAAFEP